MNNAEFALFRPDKLRLAVIAAWYDAMSRAVDEECYSDPHITPQDVPGMILSAVATTLGILARDRNLRELAGRLPNEVLARVFAELDLSQRLAMSLVSKRWSEVIFNTPALWSTAGCNGTERSACQMVEVLRLAGHAPVTMDVLLTRDNVKFALRAILENVNRCVELRINFGERRLDARSTIGTLRSCLARPAPLLQRLSLHEEFDWFLKDGMLAGISIFDGNAPNLAYIDIRCPFTVFNGVGMTAFRNVTSASLEQVVSPLDVTGFTNLLGSLTSLAHLRMVIESSVHDDRLHMAVQLPRTLRSLEVINTQRLHPSDRQFALLRILQWEHLERVAVEICEHANSIPEAELVDFFVHSWPVSSRPFRSAWIGWAEQPAFIFTGVNVVVADGDLYAVCPAVNHVGASIPSVEVAERSLFQLHQPLPEAVFASVTRLSLHELLFDSHVAKHPLPTFSAVIDLTVLLMNTHFTRHHLGISPFLQLSLQYPVVHVPVLQTLTLAAELEPEPSLLRQQLTPLMVCTFMAHHLKYDLDRVKRLTFLGVELLVGPAEELAVMLQQAEIVQWDDRLVAWSANLNASAALSIY